MILRRCFDLASSCMANAIHFAGSSYPLAIENDTTYLPIADSPAQEPAP